MVGPVFYEHYNGLNKIDILDAKLENSSQKNLIEIDYGKIALDIFDI